MDFKNIKNILDSFKDMELYLYWSHRLNVVTPDGEPLICLGCGAEPKDFKDVVKSIDGGIISEYEVKCEKCEYTVGYWSYGSWCL